MFAQKWAFTFECVCHTYMYVQMRTSGNAQNLFYLLLCIWSCVCFFKINTLCLFNFVSQFTGNLSFSIFFLGIPIVSVMYVATWNFTEDLVSSCKNILTSQLEDNVNILEWTLSNNCHLLNISAHVQLTSFSFSTFQVLL